MRNDFKFKPNLIPNNQNGLEDVFAAIEANGGYERYKYAFKKDGVRMEVVEEQLLGRSLKPSKSILVSDRFKRLVEIFAELDIVAEGEFYCHGMKFNEIQRFYSNTDVTSLAERKKLEGYAKQFVVSFEEATFDEELEEWIEGGPIYSTVKEFDKHKYSGLQTRLDYEYEGRSIEWLTTFHTDLKFYLFDGFIIGEQGLPFKVRWDNILRQLFPYRHELEGVLILNHFLEVGSRNALIELFQLALASNYEGLIAVHEDHQYKFDRSTHKEGGLLKMKNDEGLYDGVILDVLEGTMIREGIDRTTNELGRSVTSKCKGDRESSGLAKGFLVSYEGFQFIVSLKGFNNDAKRELLKNKSEYIGRNFIYTAMPPVKDVPRHAKFKVWRDEK